MKISWRFIIGLFILWMLFACKPSESDNDNDDDNNGNNPPPPTQEAIIIDHTCTDINKIPDTWIEKAKGQFKIHYAHTSHGEQITTGLERLSQGIGLMDITPVASKYGFARQECQIPAGTGQLCLMDGQFHDSNCETYIVPELYWQGEEGLNITRQVLKRFTGINISMWAWCTQLDYFNDSETSQYLNAMNKLEQEFPSVRFIYMTGNAQSQESNRQNRNNQIRDWCRQNKKVLFDFADLDCWYNGQSYNQDGIPMEHPQYHGDDAGHTSYRSCENKAKVFWWLLARLAGWDGKTTSQNP